MSNTLDGKAVLVTGGGSGIGRAGALIMASRGAKLAISDLRLEAAEEVAAEICKAGGNAIAIKCDVEFETEIAAAIAATVAAFGRIDVLHNNAALLAPEVIVQDTDILSIPTDIWDRVMAVTLRGPMLGSRYAVQEMRKTGGGSIINTSSIFGLSAHNQQVAYGCAKAGVSQLTQFVATSFGQDNIRCNAVAPSLILTPTARAAVPDALRAAHLSSTLLPFLGEPEDVGHMVAFLASDDARFITGQTIRVDGGMMAHLATYADAKRFFDSCSST
jgi:NAD(P)-dependent dehydrogenase (short-subunit alcohol dehydrogenase family)